MALQPLGRLLLREPGQRFTDDIRKGNVGLLSDDAHVLSKKKDHRQLTPPVPGYRAIPLTAAEDQCDVPEKGSLAAARRTENRKRRAVLVERFPDGSTEGVGRSDRTYALASDWTCRNPVGCLRHQRKIDEYLIHREGVHAPGTQAAEIDVVVNTGQKIPIVSLVARGDPAQRGIGPVGGPVNPAFLQFAIHSAREAGSK